MVLNSDAESGVAQKWRRSDFFVSLEERRYVYGRKDDKNEYYGYCRSPRIANSLYGLMMSRDNANGAVVMDMSVLMVMETQPDAYEKEQGGQQYGKLFSHEEAILGNYLSSVN